MRVLYTNPTSQIGGAEVCLLDLAGAVAKDGVDVLVACPSEGPLRERLAARGISSVVTPLGELSRRHLLRFGRGVQTLSRVALRFGADILHSNSMVLTEQTVLAARRARARSVCHIRDLCPILGARWLRRHCLNHCGRVIAISDAVRRDLIDRIGVEPDRIERVYDGLQLAAPRERSDAFFTGTRLEGLRRVGVVARLSREKGQDTFLEAAARVAQEMDDVGFVIAGDAALGDGAYARELVDQAERLGLSGRTLFTGFTERVPELMAGLDALVVPSHTEPFGLVTVEAMAAGVPVVATDSGGSPELVEHGATGLLVLPRDPGRMAEAVISLLRDREHASAMAAAGCERARERFGIERHIGAMRDVYDHALEAK